MKISTIKRMVQEELAIALNNSNNTVKKEKPLAPVIPWEKVIPGQQNFSNTDASSCCQASEPDQTGQEIHPDDHEHGHGDDRMKKIISILKIMKAKQPETAVFEGQNVVLGKATRGDISEYLTYLKDCKSGKIKKVNFGKSK